MRSRRQRRPPRPVLAGCPRCRHGGTLDIRWRHRMRVGGVVRELVSTVAAACPICPKGAALTRSIGRADLVLARLERDPSTIAVELVGEPVPPPASTTPAPTKGSSWVARSAPDEDDDELARKAL